MNGAWKSSGGSPRPTPASNYGDFIQNFERGRLLGTCRAVSALMLRDSAGASPSRRGCYTHLQSALIDLQTDELVHQEHEELRVRESAVGEFEDPLGREPT